MKNKLALLALLLIVAACSHQTFKILSSDDYKKLSEDDRRQVPYALTGVELADPNLGITLFASEPMIANPTNMDIDAKGRVWICEAMNYRPELNPSNPYHKEGDRIVILEDANGDGKADKSKVFYQGTDIDAALGIAVLGNKVYVSRCPNILVFTDENGDDVADKKEILLTGTGNGQHDHALHAVVFGPDGKLYFNHGNESTIQDKNGQPLKDDLGREINNKIQPYQQGMTLRCDLDGSNVEVLGWNFRNNYEVAVDAFGRMWQSDNDDDGNKGVRINYVMDYGNYGYHDEITGAAWQERRTNWEDEIPKRHWHLNDPGVVPNLLQTGAGSPCGMVVYEGNLLPPQYQNQIIHADAGPNIVRAYPVENDGAGFKATIANILDGSKRDNWFRPSDVTVAPDGSLFVADWYDAGVGGHAAADTNRGRIYRIAPKALTQIYKNPSFNFSTTEGCAEALKNPNLAVRFLAWTKLKAFGTEAERALNNLYSDQNPRIRARALWLLGLLPNGKAYIQKGFRDNNENIRCTAIRMAVEKKEDVLFLAEEALTDMSWQVKREALLAIRHQNSVEAARIWAKLARQYQGFDRWYLEAIGIGAADNWDLFFGEWFKLVGERWKVGVNRDIVWRSRSSKTAALLAELIKVSNGKEQLRYFRALDFQNSDDKTDLLLQTLSDGTASDDLALLVFKHIDPKKAIISPIFQNNLPKVLAATKDATDFFDLCKRFNLTNQNARLITYAMDVKNWNLAREAAQIIFKNSGTTELERILRGSNEAEKLAAIRSFGSVDQKPTNAIFTKLMLDANQNMPIREAATRALGGWNGQDITWDLVKNNQFPKELIELVKPNLTNSWHSEIRAAAYQHFMGDVKSDYGNLTDLVKLKGKAGNGLKIYDAYCATCHKLNGKGADFGPNLAEIGGKLSKLGLYSAIVNPSQGISFGYEGFILKMKNGDENQGMILSKTENEVVLKELSSPEPKRYKRSDIAQIVSMDASLMPKFPLQKQELVDLVTFLTTLRKSQ